MHPNGSKAVFSYDSLARLTGLANRKSDNSLLTGFNYGFDNRDVRTYQERQVGTNPLQHIDYTYDATNQLTQELSIETPTPQVRANYTYDAMGNRTQVLYNGGSGAGGTTANYTPNPLNQIANVDTTVGGNPTRSQWYGYWGGNLTDSGNNIDSSGFHYSYTDKSELYQTTDKNAAGVNQTRRDFVYDGFGRLRISREYSWNAGTSSWTLLSEKRRVYDGMDVVQERDATNAVTATYTRSGNIGGILSRTVGANHYYYHYDGSGNVVQLTDSTQAPVANYTYDAYGNATSSGTQANANPYRYSTKEQIGGLYYYGYRFYSPGLGRWINRDPLAEAGGMNLYKFVGDSPINLTDLYGLIPVPPGVDITKNCNIAEEYRNGLITGLLWFNKQVRNKGPWDYKQQGRQYQDFGNFNFGATGHAAGIPLPFLLRRAGDAQVKARTSRPEWGVPSPWNAWGGVAPFGDDPHDQSEIIRGWNYYSHIQRAQVRKRFGDPIMCICHK